MEASSRQTVWNEIEQALLGTDVPELQPAIQHALRRAASLLGARAWSLWVQGPDGALVLSHELSQSPQAEGDGALHVALAGNAGRLVLHRTRDESAVSAEQAAQARRLGLWLGNACMRLGWDRAPGLLQATLDAWSPYIGMTDDAGRLVMVNAAWKAAAEAGALPLSTPLVSVPLARLGQNYLERCDAARSDSIEAGVLADAARAMLRGERTSLRLEYPAQDTRPRWFQVHVAQFESQKRRYLIFAHRELTQLKLVEERHRALSRRLLRVQDEERKRIADDLHDGAAQNVFAAVLTMGRVRNRVVDLHMEEALAEAETLCRDALKQIRTVSYLLHPALLDEAGLVPALTALLSGFSQRSGIRSRIDAPELGRLCTEIERGLFRVVQEALANVQRHSQANEVELVLKRGRNQLSLTVRDNGRGIPEPETEAIWGVGLGSMRERVHQLSGEMFLRSPSDGGTELVVTVPADPSE